jgi:predicted nucleic acid-binding protein
VQLDLALTARSLVLPPVIAAELLAAPGADSAMRRRMLDVPLLPTGDGYWHRVGDMRALLRSRGRRARLGDALISQSCIDHDVALITRDNDFRAYAEFCGLKLA